jgi:hypothetical protein
VQHAWERPEEHARRPFAPIREHVLLPVAASIAEADARLAPLVDEELLVSLVEAVPAGWLGGDGRFPDLGAERRAYVDYLLRGVGAPRALFEEG